MSIHHAIWLGPPTGPLALSWRPLYPHARGGFGGVTPMTLCPSLFFSFSQSICLPHLRILHYLGFGGGARGCA
jgi:hypothetical protein